MFGHSMFGVFEVQYFGVRSKTNFGLTLIGHVLAKKNSYFESDSYVVGNFF